MIRPFLGMFPITQEWGINPQNYVQFGLKGHNGVDYGTPTGTPILAPHSGKVIEAAFDQYGYGNYVKIENDVEGSILAHFQSFNVNAGDTVSEGQQVGISNNTGNSTGPHLHWGYFRKPRNKSDGFSGTTNPFPYIEAPQQPNPTTPPLDDKDNIIKALKEQETVLRNAITQKDALLVERSNEIGVLQQRITNIKKFIQNA
jgi:murein DD-endopeptidase MepM/ murein hydrolase activator NlpD